MDILICTFTFIFVVLFYFVILWIKLIPYNQKPLEIRTFDNSNSPYHPSVIYFKNGWNGYKYWMAETPFPPQGKPYRDRQECPSIHVSNDGINWTEIKKNPIDDLTETDIKDFNYFSDPHLVFVDNNLECWYRITHRKGIIDNFKNIQLVRKRSCDGINWSTREVMVDLATVNGDSLGNMVVSPAILYQNGKYRMWYVNSESRTHRELSYSESYNGIEWTIQKRCILAGAENMPWHIDVNFIDNKYYLVSYNFKNLTLWESDNGITFNYIKKVLEPSVIGSFYSEGLYRACIIKDKNLKIYFSANDAFKTYIGLLQEYNERFTFVAEGRHQNIISLQLYVYAKKWVSIKFISRKFFNIFTAGYNKFARK
ncbi:MAG: hypothetical protein IKW46_03580 [Bacteroidaceae bacterium]|nr:hypothetical protein [Bacteroidaceae bacterium]